VIADISTPAGRDLVRDLAADADVLLENFKVGGLARYGLDYAALAAINPRLVYCSITGFGQDGPYANRPGYDFITQGMGGMMALTGEPDGAPQKSGVPMSDIATGLYAVIAIQAALAMRERTGQGQHIDMSLLDTTIGVLANQSMNWFVSGIDPPRMGNSHPNISPYAAFPAADGWFILTVGNDEQFRRFCNVVGLGLLATDIRFATNGDRIINRSALFAEIERACSNFARDDLLSRLESAGVPAGPINTVAQAFDDRQVIARGMRVDVARDGGAPLPAVRTPIRFSGAALALNHAAPRLGADMPNEAPARSLWRPR
jgi:crotonobetainyl-CoA:carnitine CoA-transferase CaiB-like acyl-CoA transferase